MVGVRRARLPGEVLFARMPWRFPRTFGLAEVGLYAAGGSLDFVRRHMAIVNELELLRGKLHGRLRVLDYGGANSPLSTFLRLYGLADRYQVVVADVDVTAIANATLRKPLDSAVLLEPNGTLPFADGAFDAVVSSDVFEHIPRRDRPRWAKELHRVARHAQIHNIPCDGDDYVSSKADAAYQRWHIGRFGAPEPWTAEHIANGVPSVEELMMLFPGAMIRGIANADLWLRTMKAEATQSSIAGRFARAVAYAIGRRHQDSHGPFKACLITTSVGHSVYGEASSSLSRIIR